MEKTTEISGNFYDLEYFISMEYRYFSDAHRGRVENILSVIGDVNGKKILDVGCGGGFFVNKLMGGGVIVTGIDYAESGIEFTKERFPNLDVKVGDVLDLDFDDNTFDMVIMIDTIEHIKNYTKALSEVKRVLKVDGILIVATDTDDVMGRWTNLLNRFSKDGRAYRMIKRVESHRKKFKNYHKSHVNEMSHIQLRKALSDFKFIDYKIYYNVRVPIRDILIKLFGLKFGNHQCIIVKKIQNN